MKNIFFLKVIILILVVSPIFSCDDDDNDLNVAVDLIGEWQRSDFNNEFEYKLIFNSDNSGYRTQREGAIGGQAISSATGFNWFINENILSIDYDDEIVTTSFYINSNGQLFLSDLTNLYFIKLE